MAADDSLNGISKSLGIGDMTNRRFTANQITLNRIKYVVTNFLNNTQIFLRQWMKLHLIIHGM